MNVKFIVHTCLLFFIVVSSSCKKKCHDVANPDCESYDPCYGKTRINANFRVRPGDNGFKLPEQWCDLIPCDTFNASSVRFDAPINNPSNCAYSWQIGTEPIPRTGNGFEVDFSDYLDNGKWETNLPVSITIKTPLNSCMTHPEDTLITVTRNLFFTKKNYYIFNSDSSFSLFEGYMLENPSKIFRVKTASNSNKYYKDFQTDGYNFFLIGMPIADTILMPFNIFIDNKCSNYKHKKILTISNQNPLEFLKLQKYSQGLMMQDYYYLGNNNFSMRLEFHHDNKVEIINYRCKKLQ